MHNAEIVVVGAGLAGCAAAIEILRLGMTPLLVDRTGRAGGLIINARRVEGQLGLDTPVDGPTYVRNMTTQLARLGISVRRGTVTRVTLHQPEFNVDIDGQATPAGSVIVANGTEPKLAGFDGEDMLSGRVLFREVGALLAAIAQPSQVAVIGSDEIACNYALTLADRGASVHLLVEGEACEARGRIVEELRQNPRIVRAFKTRCVAARSNAQGANLELVRAGEHQSMRVDAVLLALGRESRASQLLGGLQSIVHQDTATAIPGLFVAGNARSGFVGFAGTAAADGVLAARMAVTHIERSLSEGHRSAGPAPI